MHPYDYFKSEPHFNLEPQITGSELLLYEVTFPSAHHNHYQENDTARGQYFTPCASGHFPLVILLHGLGDRAEKNIVPCRTLARWLARIGIASFMLQLPVPVLLIDNLLELFQVMVINTRQVVDWAESRDELDTQRVAVVGISIGGMASSIAMAVDKRIMAGIFLVAGGNMGNIAWGSNDPGARMGHDCTESQCREIYSHYPQYLADIADRGVENVVPAKECFLFDPISFGRYLRGRPLLMINSEFDHSVPRDSTLDFWEVCGRPRLVWLPANHYTIFWNHNSIRTEATAFLKSTFGMSYDTER